MDNMYFNKNAGKPKRPSGRSDGYIDDFEDISSFSENSVEDEYEDISSGRDIYFDDISSGSHGRNDVSFIFLLFLSIEISIMVSERDAVSPSRASTPSRRIFVTFLSE